MHRYTSVAGWGCSCGIVTDLNYNAFDPNVINVTNVNNEKN